MLKLLTIQNEGQKRFNNLLLVPSIKSFLEVDDENGNFLFTQIKLLDGTTLRVKDTVDQIHTILTGTDEDAVGVLTIWLEEDGSIPEDVLGLFA